VVAAVLAAGSEKEAAHRLGLAHSTVKHRLAMAAWLVSNGYFVAPRNPWLPPPQTHQKPNIKGVEYRP
jgi:hypothetical protein